MSGQRRRRAAPSPQAPPTTASAPPVVVPNLSQFLRDSAQAIAREIGCAHLRFSSAETQGGGELYRLDGQDATLAEEKYPYSVIPVLRPLMGQPRYWLGAAIRVEHAGRGTSLAHVSMTIVEGIASDPRKRPLIRTEWDCRPASRVGKHAQPHWHIYPSSLTTRPSGADETFQADDTVREFDTSADGYELDERSASTWSGGEHFHFAMAVRWHIDGPEAPNELVDSERLIQWLQGCVRYTLEELTFLHERGGGAT